MNRSKPLLNLVCFVGMMFLLIACSVEKRLYNKGFHISRKHVFVKSEQLTNEKIQAADSVAVNAENSHKNVTLSNVLDSNETDELPSQDCDTIVLKNADTLIGKVAVLNDRWLLLDDCDSVLVNRPTIYRDQLHEIRYADGRVELINEYKHMKKKQLYHRSSTKKFTPFYFLALVLLIFEIAAVLLVLGGVGETPFLVVALAIGVLAIIANFLSIIFHKRRNKPIALRVSAVQMITVVVAFLTSIIFGFFEYLYF